MQSCRTVGPSVNYQPGTFRSRHSRPHASNCGWSGLLLSVAVSCRRSTIEKPTRMMGTATSRHTLIVSPSAYVKVLTFAYTRVVVSLRTAHTLPLSMRALRALVALAAALSASCTVRVHTRQELSGASLVPDSRTTCLNCNVCFIPGCAADCAELVSENGPCAANDFVCVCLNSASVNSAETCIVEKCTSNALSQFNDFCAQLVCGITSHCVILLRGSLLPRRWTQEAQPPRMVAASRRPRQAHQTPPPRLPEAELTRRGGVVAVAVACCRQTRTPGARTRRRARPLSPPIHLLRGTVAPQSRSQAAQ